MLCLITVEWCKLLQGIFSLNIRIPDAHASILTWPPVDRTTSYNYRCPYLAWVQNSLKPFSDRRSPEKCSQSANHDKNLWSVFSRAIFSFVGYSARWFFIANDTPCWEALKMDEDFFLWITKVTNSVQFVQFHLTGINVCNVARNKR